MCKAWNKFIYLLIGIISFIFVYVAFVNIPFIYIVISSIADFLKVGAGYGRLNSIVLTNFIYLVLLIIALLGLYQIREAKKARVMNSLSAFFKFLYDEKTVRIKGLIRENKSIFLSLNTVETYKKGGSPIEVEKIREDLRTLHTKTVKGKGIEQFSRVLTLYNNIGLLVEREHLELKNLPSIFPKNVIVYWEIFEKYVRLKRIADDPIKINSKEIEHDFYAEHFEALYKECKKYLAKRYLSLRQR